MDGPAFIVADNSLLYQTKSSPNSKEVVKQKNQASKRGDGQADDEENAAGAEDVEENVKSKCGRKPVGQGKKP